MVKWRDYDPSRHWELTIHWHSIPSQKTGMFVSTIIRNLTQCVAPRMISFLKDWASTLHILRNWSCVYVFLKLRSSQLSWTAWWYWLIDWLIVIGFETSQSRCTYALNNGPVVPHMNLWEPYCITKVPDGPQLYALNVLWLQDKWAQTCMSELKPKLHCLMVRWRDNDPSRHWELIIHWHSITSQKTGMFISTIIRTSNLTQSVVPRMISYLKDWASTLHILRNWSCVFVFLELRSVIIHILDIDCNEDLRWQARCAHILSLNYQANGAHVHTAPSHIPSRCCQLLEIHVCYRL